MLQSEPPKNEARESVGAAPKIFMGASEKGEALIPLSICRFSKQRSCEGSVAKRERRSEKTRVQ